MEEKKNTVLTVTDENGKEITIDVIDIFSFEDSPTEYIIYELNNNIYAAILYEEDDSFEIQTIEDKNDYARVMARIEELTSEGE